MRVFFRMARYEPRNRSQSQKMEWGRFLIRTSSKQLHIPTFLVLVHRYRINIPYKLRFNYLLCDILLAEFNSILLKNHREICKRCYWSIDLFVFHCYSLKVRPVYCTCHQIISVSKTFINNDFRVFRTHITYVLQSERWARTFKNDLVISINIICSCGFPWNQLLYCNKKKHVDYKRKTHRIKLFPDIVWRKRPRY